jgi:hypothetical protein
MRFEEAQYRRLQNTAGMTILREFRNYLPDTTAQLPEQLSFQEHCSVNRQSRKRKCECQRFSIDALPQYVIWTCTDCSISALDCSYRRDILQCGKYITNAWKVLNCGTGEGWRSDGPIVRRIKILLIVNKKRIILSTIKTKEV